MENSVVKQASFSQPGGRKNLNAWEIDGKSDKNFKNQAEIVNNDEKVPSLTPTTLFLQLTLHV